MHSYRSQDLNKLKSMRSTKNPVKNTSNSSLLFASSSPSISVALNDFLEPTTENFLWIEKEPRQEKSDDDEEWIVQGAVVRKFDFIVVISVVEQLQFSLSTTMRLSHYTHSLSDDDKGKKSENSQTKFVSWINFFVAAIILASYDERWKKTFLPPSFIHSV